MDQGKEEPSKSLQGSNSYKKQEMETTSTDQKLMDKGKEKVSVRKLEGTNTLLFKRTKIEDTSDGQKKENAIERAIREENRLRKMKMDAAAGASAEKKEETEEDSIDLLLKQELEGTSTEYSTEEEKASELEVYSKPVETVVVSTSEEEEEEETILSPKESSTNRPKGLKMNVDQQPAGNNQDEQQLTLSPEEALKNKQVIEEEEEEEEIEIVESLSDDTFSDACTRKLSTSPIDKFMDSDKDKSMRSPPGDQGL